MTPMVPSKSCSKSAVLYSCMCANSLLVTTVYVKGTERNWKSVGLYERFFPLTSFGKRIV